MTDLVAGRVSIMFDALASLLPFILAGKLRALAAGIAERNRLLPDLPTMTELGYGMDISLWYGVAAPALTPAPIARRLNGELAKILELPDVRKSFADQGADAKGGTPEEFSAFMREESAKLGAVVTGIKAE